MGPRECLDNMVKTKILTYMESNPDSPSCSLLTVLTELSIWKRIRKISNAVGFIVFVRNSRSRSRTSMSLEFLLFPSCHISGSGSTLSLPLSSECDQGTEHYYNWFLLQQLYILNYNLLSVLAQFVCRIQGFSWDWNNACHSFCTTKFIDGQSPSSFSLPPVHNCCSIQIFHVSLWS